MSCPSRLILEGRSYVVTICEPGCGGRGSVVRERCGQGGCPCEPVATCGRATPKSGEASWRSRMSCVRQNRVVLAVVATVKSLGDVREPNRADGVNSRGEGGQKESSAPGRARHKPSDHRAGKAE